MSAAKLTPHQASHLRRCARALQSPTARVVAQSRRTILAPYGVHSIAIVGSAGALGHLEHKGYLAVEVIRSGRGAEQRYYRLTELGQQWYERQQAREARAAVAS